MAIGPGDVIWLNSGQGPYTATIVSTDVVPLVTITTGSGNNQSIPVVCFTKKNPVPKLDYDRSLLTGSLQGTGSSTVGSS